MQNAKEPVAECVRRINEAGMMVAAGFILGFDHEKRGAAQAIAECVEESGISTAMVGLLTSLPNTQLNDRLIREGRLLVREKGTALEPGEIDQTTSGINFTPLRPRQEILREFQDMLNQSTPQARFSPASGSSCDGTGRICATGIP